MTQVVSRIPAVDPDVPEVKPRYQMAILSERATKGGGSLVAFVIEQYGGEIPDLKTEGGTVEVWNGLVSGEGECDEPVGSDHTDCVLRFAAEIAPDGVKL